MRLLHIFADGMSEFNSSMHRGAIFVDALNRAGHLSTLMGVDEWMKDGRRDVISQSDIIVVERLLVEEARDRAAYWHSRGKAVVIDIDDSYSLLQDEKTSGNQAAKFWQRGEVDIHYGSVTYSKKLSVSPLEQFRQGLQNVTGLTSPSRILNEDWAMYSKTWLVPNYIDAELYLPFRKKYASIPKELLIGWGGSMSHKISFERSGVAEALRKIIAKYPHVKFLLAGDNRIINILKLPPDRIIYQPYVAYFDFPNVLARFDIGIAPLQGRYDHSRSSIKSQSLSLMGIPFVATGCPTYEEHQRADMGLYVEDSPEYDDKTVSLRAVQWEAQLSDIIENYDIHKKKIDSQFDLALDWSIDRRIGDVISTYEDIIAHK